MQYHINIIDGFYIHLISVTALSTVGVLLASMQSAKQEAWCGKSGG
jgi:hypothetical protein